MPSHDREPALGSTSLAGNRTRFLVWAPKASTVAVRLTSSSDRTLPLEPLGGGYHSATAEDCGPGARYVYVLDGRLERPDPASRLQPEGVHGPSEVVGPEFAWTDTGWTGLPLESQVLYELHVGVYTAAGTFDAVAGRLEHLKRLGVTTLQLMPVAQFPGERNWGYDGVYPFSVQPSYGGRAGLKRLVDRCHACGLAVSLDVVYNHLGPEGNYLWDYGPYFTERYRSPWGDAVNFDGPGSDDVRRYFLENALVWVTEFHVDMLRLDAVHAIFDRSARPFLLELAEAVHRRAAELGRQVQLVAECDLDDPRFVRPSPAGGLGLEALWNDGFHHALRALLTGERAGYYVDYGSLEHLARAYRDGFVHSGQFSAYRGRRHGAPASDLPGSSLVVFSQNHDQVGNRMLGERLDTHVGLAGAKLAAASVLLSPFVPLLFMGEEYGEAAPFQYFVSHSDPALIEAVRQGRKQEFASFLWKGEPPDPQALETFERCKLDPAGGSSTERQCCLLAFYRALLELRRGLPELAVPDRGGLQVIALEEQRTLLLLRKAGRRTAAILLHFGQTSRTLELPFPGGRWRLLLDSESPAFGGEGGGLPAELESRGVVTLTMLPRSASVFEQG
jgi:maltooligosyltrehalose trehalohydrolase